jgi:hypothetical protein
LLTDTAPIMFPLRSLLLSPPTQNGGIEHSLRLDPRKPFYLYGLEMHSRPKLISAPRGASVQEEEFTLHWADTDYSRRTNPAETVATGFSLSLEAVVSISPLPLSKRRVRPTGRGLPFHSLYPRHLPPLRLISIRANTAFDCLLLAKMESVAPRNLS